MIALWIAIAVAGTASALWLARPFLLRASVEMNETESVISIFRDQLDEIERDLEAGLISERESEAARQEIESRALKAAQSMDSGLSVSRRKPALALSLAAVTLAATVVVYLGFGAPEMRDRPLAERRSEELTRKAAAGDLNSRIELLIERTQKDPGGFEGWWMLARSHAAVGDHASSAEAYRRAAELSGDRPSVLSAYAEALTLANGNKVPQAARLVFEQILTRAPDPRARYYLALAKAQAKNFEAALEDWALLARESQSNAPWMALVRRDIVNMSRFTGKDVTAYLPDASPTEIARASGNPETAPAAANPDRIAALEARLEGKPRDYKGWIELARLRAARGEDEQAATALDRARELYAAAPFVMSKIEETARDLGLDMLAGEETTKGPTADDMAAAAKMSDAERDEMIKGMVAGLAARLEEQPDDPSGWVMLIRSRAVLGQRDEARAAYTQAQAHFAKRPDVLARLKTEAGELLASP